MSKKKYNNENNDMYDQEVLKKIGALKKTGDKGIKKEYLDKSRKFTNRGVTKLKGKYEKEYNISKFFDEKIVSEKGSGNIHSLYKKEVKGNVFKLLPKIALQSKNIETTNKKTRYLFHYDYYIKENGERSQLKTASTDGSVNLDDAIKALDMKLNKAYDNYKEIDVASISTVKIEQGKTFFGQGGKSKQAACSQWKIVSPETRKNCLYTAAIIARDPKDLEANMSKCEKAKHRLNVKSSILKNKVNHGSDYSTYGRMLRNWQRL